MCAQREKQLPKNSISRRNFLKWTARGALTSLAFSAHPLLGEFALPPSRIFSITDIPDNPFTDQLNPNYHAGFESLLPLMAKRGLKFYQSLRRTTLSGPLGMIAAHDVVLIKVNAQWKYRGATNSDLVRGVVQRILDHPDGFKGEIVIYENGQGRGSLNCDTSAYPDNKVHANANDESHSFIYLVNTIFKDSRVSAYLADPIRGTFIGNDNHISDGYRIIENVSYPCFTTARGFRLELREGIWNGMSYERNLKLINIPVLKTHDGSEITASLKHYYGILSMSDGQSGFRHYSGLGETCGKMVVSVRAPVLNIMDCIWVSHKSLAGYPASTTFRANRIVASQDPVALDYWAAKYILYPIDNNPSHHPDNPTISGWLTSAQNMINDRGGIYDPQSGILQQQVTKNEEWMRVYSATAS